MENLFSIAPGKAVRTAIEHPNGLLSLLFFPTPRPAEPLLRKRRLISRGKRAAAAAAAALNSRPEVMRGRNNCLGKDERFNYIENAGQKGRVALREARLIRPLPRWLYGEKTALRFPSSFLYFLFSPVLPSFSSFFLPGLSSPSALSLLIE